MQRKKVKKMENLATIARETKRVSGTYTVYKDEFHPLFIDFLRGMSSCDVCNDAYNFYREVVSESKTRFVLSLRDDSVCKIQDAMFLSAVDTAKLIWG
jgi:hypothetical protein